MCIPTTGDISWQSYVASRRAETQYSTGHPSPSRPTRSGGGRSACCCGAAFHSSHQTNATMIMPQRASEIGRAMTKPFQKEECGAGSLESRPGSEAPRPTELLLRAPGGEDGKRAREGGRLFMFSARGRRWPWSAVISPSPPSRWW
jgi:hypothetical protein